MRLFLFAFLSLIVQDKDNLCFFFKKQQIKITNEQRHKCLFPVDPTFQWSQLNFYFIEFKVPAAFLND